MAYCGPRGLRLGEFLSWPQSDQDAALEWQSHENARDRDCGTHPEDWVGNPHAHHAHTTTQCPGCLRKHRLTEALTKGGKEPLPPGVHVVLSPGPAKDCPVCNPPAKNPAPEPTGGR